MGEARAAWIRSRPAADVEEAAGEIVEAREKDDMLGMVFGDPRTARCSCRCRRGFAVQVKAKAKATLRIALSSMLSQTVESRSNGKVNEVLAGRGPRVRACGFLCFCVSVLLWFCGSVVLGSVLAGNVG